MVILGSSMPLSQALTHLWEHAEAFNGQLERADTRLDLLEAQVRPTSIEAACTVLVRYLDSREESFQALCSPVQDQGTLLIFPVSGGYINIRLATVEAWLVS